jgi:hypothetical protein
MNNAFIIIQIGNSELEKLCTQSIIPAIEACGLSAKRVDKHNEGGLLKSEIIKFIESSEIIIADLTYERPNCYLEIGYTMGIDKFRNLILTAREDHNLDSKNYKTGGPKIHFDLSGYDILFWNPLKLDDFRTELEKRIKRRLAIIQPTSEEPKGYWNIDWISSHQATALAGLSKTGVTGFMEARFALDYPKPDWTQKILDDAARASNINTFGWPIAVYLGNREEFRPKPKSDGIVAEISSGTYDYWAIGRNGDFYMLKSLFEDSRDASKIFFDTRINRVTELFLYCARLYDRLGVDRSSFINIVVRHSGLKNRTVKAANPNRLMLVDHSTTEDESITELRIKLEEIETILTSLVKQVTAPMFILFDYLEISDGIYNDIVNSFVQGRIA